MATSPGVRVTIARMTILVAVAALLLAAFRGGRWAERRAIEAEPPLFGSAALARLEQSREAWIEVEGKPDGGVRIAVHPSGVSIEGKKLEVPLGLSLAEKARDRHAFEYRPGVGIEHTTTGPDGRTRREVVASNRIKLDAR